MFVVPLLKQTSSHSLLVAMLSIPIWATGSMLSAGPAIHKIDLLFNVAVKLNGMLATWTSDG